MSDSVSRDPIQTEWAGVERWQCPFCPRDGSDRDAIAAHIADAHPEPAKSVPELIAAENAAAEQTVVTSQPDASRGEPTPSAPEPPAQPEPPGQSPPDEPIAPAPAPEEEV